MLRISEDKPPLPLYAFLACTNLPLPFNNRARGSAVGWGTALQAGRSRVRFPMVSLDFFHLHNPSSHAMTLRSAQLLTEMSTRTVSWGVKAAGAYGWQPYHLHVLIVLKSGSLSLLETSGSVQACNGIALPLPWFCCQPAFDNVANIVLWLSGETSPLCCIELSSIK